MKYFLNIWYNNIDPSFTKINVKLACCFLSCVFSCAPFVGRCWLGLSLSKAWY